MTDQLQQMFHDSTVEANCVKPPEARVDPKLYADYKKMFTQNLGKWKGGKKQHFEFDYDPTGLLTKLRNGEKPNFKQEWHYFPTPQPVIDQMCNICIPYKSSKILEPSAGRGALIEGVNAFMQVEPAQWTIIEPHPVNRKFLVDKGLTPHWDDFDTYEAKGDHDLIYANPPFMRDKPHVEKMADCLSETGSMVVVLPANFEGKYEKWLDSHLRPLFEDVSFYDVPDDSFKESGTGVSTTILAGMYRL